MAADDRAVDHVLPVPGQPEPNQRREHCVPHTLFSPTPETDIDRVPLPIALMHVAPGAADAQHMQHPVQKPPVVVGWAGFAAALCRPQHPDDGPLRIRHVPSTQRSLQKGGLESEITPFWNPTMSTRHRRSPLGGACQAMQKDGEKVILTILLLVCFRLRVYFVQKQGLSCRFSTLQLASKRFTRHLISRRMNKRLYWTSTFLIPIRMRVACRETYHTPSLKVVKHEDFRSEQGSGSSSDLRQRYG
jgi:hypothetical protein